MVAAEPLSQEQIVRAAAEFIEREGADALTMRLLGNALKIDPSSIYRFFKNKSELLGAVGSSVLTNVRIENITGESPREQLHSMAREVRRVIMEKPTLGALLATSPSGSPAEVNALAIWATGQLRAMGLVGTDIVDAYQSLEGFVLGVTTYDISSLPDPIEARRQWCRSMEIPEFDEVARSKATIQDLNARVFELGLNGLLNQFELLARK